MTLLRTMHDLTWHVKLSEGGWTCLELRNTPRGCNEASRRYGWIVNATQTGWQAHIGSWDGSGLGPQPQELKHFESIIDAQAWVVQQVAVWWFKLAHLKAAQSQ